MKALDSEIVLYILKQRGKEWKVQPSPRKGYVRINDMSNDVTCAIDNMGGIERAAKTLGVSVDEINRWMDEHYVPEPYVYEVRRHTGYLDSLQRSPFYVFDGSRFWPHLPTQEEFNMPEGPPIHIPLMVHSKAQEH